MCGVDLSVLSRFTFEMDFVVGMLSKQPNFVVGMLSKQPNNCFV